jgi:hypothetical protein
MEIQRFDALSRQLSQGESRRRLLGLFGGTALGGLLATTFGPEAEAKKKKKKKSCKKKQCGECQICQKGKCKPKPDGTACTDGACQGGVCNCPSDQVCELSETCCPEPITAYEGASICSTDDVAQLCSCPAGREACVPDVGELGGCCLSSDACDPDVGCVTTTCSADNVSCTLGAASCGTNCECLAAVEGGHICADSATVICSLSGQCSNDTECSGGQVCAELGCCGGLTRCVSECAA